MFIGVLLHSPAAPSVIRCQQWRRCWPRPADNWDCPYGPRPCNRLDGRKWEGPRHSHAVASIPPIYFDELDPRLSNGREQSFALWHGCGV